MNFIDPSLEEVYQTLVENDEIVNFLKEHSLLITKSMLYEEYTRKEVEQMTYSIFTKNVSTLYDVAQVLLDFKKPIKENQIWYLLSNHIAWDRIAYALGILPDELTPNIYNQIIFTYKYCTVSSFFQNNKDKFMPEGDFFEMENNPAAKAFYDAIMKEFDKLDVVLGKCCEYLDFDKIPWDLLTYLTQLLGFEKSTIDATEKEEKRFRELAKNILDIYRIKGTDYSFELFFNFLGFEIKTREFYFDRRLYYNTNSAGNQETKSIDSFAYEYYLTTCNPVNNELPDTGIDEIVFPADITPQYSLHEFEDLCSKYGPAAVLGYSPVYNVIDENGNIIDTKEYTGKVYKYFKTNLVYYNIGLETSNPTAQQIKAITKYLDFLTPSYIMRSIKIDTFSERTDEGLGFDGDGTKNPDMYGNFNDFEMLDGEDWSQDFKNKFTTPINHDTLGVVDEGHYDGKQEKIKEYRNSLGGKEFRLPIDHKIINKSSSRFLQGATGNTLTSYKRLKYYIVNRLNDEEVESSNIPGVLVYPYFTVPPFVGRSVNFEDIPTTFTKNTENMDLVGTDENGEDKSVKEIIHQAHLINKVDFITDKTIGEFIKTDKVFNEVKPILTMNRTLVNVNSIKYGINKKYKDAYDCYNKELKGYRFSNVLDNSLDNILTRDQITFFYKYPDIYKNFTYGSLVLAYSGTLQEGQLLIYRYGNYRIPNKESHTYKTDYASYINSFDYRLEKDYRGSIKPQGKTNIGLPTKYITKQSYADAALSVKEKHDKMIKVYNDNRESPKSWYDINYVTDMLYLVRNEGEYYRAVKTPVISAACTNGISRHVFDTYESATSYFNEHTNEKVCNTEFYVTGGYARNLDNPNLYVYDYVNRKKGTIIYSIKDAKLYKVTGNADSEIIEYMDFCGKLNIYHKDPNGIYTFDNNNYSIGLGDYKDEKDLYANIDLYDYSWHGYDEQADEEDFIFYNCGHSVNWPIAKLEYSRIPRPVKASTDNIIDKDLLRVHTFEKDYSKEQIINLGKEATENSIIKFTEKEIESIGKKNFDKNLHYYKTIPQNLVDEICLKTVDNFTDLEDLNWTKAYLHVPVSVSKMVSPKNFGLYEYDNVKKEYILSEDETYISDKYYVRTVLGLLSIIEHNMENITDKKKDNREYDYYSKVSDFFQDYYRIFYYDNFSPKYFPETLAKDILEKRPGEPISDEDIFTDEQIKKIKLYYKLSIIQIASIVENIANDRIYYSFVSRWEKTVKTDVNNFKNGVWTPILKNYCPNLVNLWLEDPFKADPLNPIFFKEERTSELEKYFSENNLNSDYKKYLEYREKEIFNKPKFFEILTQDSLNSLIVPMEGECRGQSFYPTLSQTRFVKILKKTIKNLELRHGRFINIKDGAREELLGKDAYSLNGQNVYKEGYYCYFQYLEDGTRQIIQFPLRFGLTHDSNGDFFIPYNLDYGLTNYSKDYFGDHREIYSEFTELLDLFVDSLDDKGSHNIDSYLKQYYYNNLVKLYRESSMKDELPIGLSIHGKKPMLAYPKLTEYLDGSGGTFSSPSTLLSSYYNNGGKNDTDIKLGFSEVTAFINRHRETTLIFKTTHKQFMNAFGYDYNEYYKKVVLDKYEPEERINIAKEIENMYIKQFACIKPNFLFIDGSNSYYNEYYEQNNHVTLWQQLRHNFEKDYSSAVAIALDMNGLPVTDNEGFIIDEKGNRYSEKDYQKGLDRLKDSFINGYIEIKIIDKNTMQGILNIDILNDFVNSNDSRAKFDLLNIEEKELVYGHLTVKKIKQRFIDNHISFPKSLEWIGKDENNIANEYISFGNDRSVNISKRNVYTSINNEEAFSQMNYINMSERGDDNQAGYYTKHEEDVVEVSKEGYAIDVNGKEIINYDHELTFEDQGIKPKYKKVHPNLIKTNSDSDIDKSYARYGLINTESGEKIRVPLGECRITTNKDGKIILKVPSKILHTSRIIDINILYMVEYIVIRSIEMSFRNLVNKGNIKDIKKMPVLNMLYSILIGCKTGRIVKIQNAYVNNSTLSKCTYIISNAFIGSIKRIYSNIVNSKNNILEKGTEIVKGTNVRETILTRIRRNISFRIIRKISGFKKISTYNRFINKIMIILKRAFPNNLDINNINVIGIVRRVIKCIANVSKMLSSSSVGIAKIIRIVEKVELHNFRPVKYIFNRSCLSVGHIELRFQLVASKKYNITQLPVKSTIREECLIVSVPELAFIVGRKVNDKNAMIMDKIIKEHAVEMGTYIGEDGNEHIQYSRNKARVIFLDEESTESLVPLENSVYLLLNSETYYQDDEGNYNGKTNKEMLDDPNTPQDIKNMLELSNNEPAIEKGFGTFDIDKTVLCTCSTMFKVISNIKLIAKNLIRNVKLAYMPKVKEYIFNIRYNNFVNNINNISSSNDKKIKLAYDLEKGSTNIIKQYSSNGFKNINYISKPKIIV